MLCVVSALVFLWLRSHFFRISFYSGYFSAAFFPCAQCTNSSLKIGASRILPVYAFFNSYTLQFIVYHEYERTIFFSISSYSNECWVVLVQKERNEFMFRTVKMQQQKIMLNIIFWIWIYWHSVVQNSEKMCSHLYEPGPEMHKKLKMKQQQHSSECHLNVNSSFPIWPMVGSKSVNESFVCHFHSKFVSWSRKLFEDEE